MKIIIDYLLVCLILMDVIQAAVIHVPSDKGTIQAGINAAVNGDTVLVVPGKYMENINFNGKNIVVGSLMLTTGDTSYISQTVIDGDSSDSVIFINNGDSTSVLCGFTITHGNAQEGGGIHCSNSSPVLSNIRVIGNSAIMGGGIYVYDSKFKLFNSVVADNHSVDGGGICIDGSSPLLTNVTIKGNTAEGNGGGCCLSSSRPVLKNVTIKGNTAYRNGGGIELQFSSVIFDTLERCNIYLNYAGRGCDIDFYNFNEGNADIIVYADTFTVKNPTDFHAYRIDKFDIRHGKLNQSSGDLYVSPFGNNDNSGESISEPLRTISFALSKIKADSINPRKIYLSEGVYSPSETGEYFPLNMVDYVSLKGDNSGNVILDAEGISGVLNLNSDAGVEIIDLTITGGFRIEGGGGIWCDNSSPNLIQVAIIDNKAMAGGGGMDCMQNSHVNLENVTISGNEANFGGGLSFTGSSASILNTILWNNSPDEINLHTMAYGKSYVELSFTDVMDSTGRINKTNGKVYWLEGNFNSDPLFCNPDNGNYSLAENSPCIAAGKNGENIGALDIGCGSMDIENEQAGLPVQFELYQNHPNPFNPATIITYKLPKSSFVRLSVYDINGRLIETLVNEMKEAGYYSIEWNAKNISSGIYFFRINADDFISTRKCLMLK